MSKRFGFCEAGCKREVVAKEDYDTKVQELTDEIEYIKGEYEHKIADLEARVSNWKLVGTEGTTVNVVLGRTYRITQPYGEDLEVAINVNYTADGVATVLAIETPTLKHQQYFDIEFVDCVVDTPVLDKNTLGTLTYKINGVEKTVEFHQDGAEIVLTDITITSNDNVYRYYFGRENDEYIETVIETTNAELLEGDY